MNSLNNIRKFAKNTFEKNPQVAKKIVFSVNMAFAAGASVPLFILAKDDKFAQQTAVQDVIINSNNLSRCLAEGKEIGHLIEGIKETTVFSALVGLVLTPIAEHLKSTTGDILGAISVPVMAHFMGNIIDKYSGEKKKENEKPSEDKILTEEEKQKKRKKERTKTHFAVGLASVIKAGLYVNNIKKGNGHTSNAIMLSSLLNSLKTSVTTEVAFQKQETVRDAKDVIGILFDGVVSPFVTQQILNLGQRANLSSGVGMVVAKSLVGSIIASGGLNGLTYLLDKALNWYFDDKKPE
jgi:uncharacterized protein (DUF697 family)